MKILIDQEELNRAFDLVDEVKIALYTMSDGDMLSIEEYGGLLQKACNILGPMWANGVNTEKVLVDAKALYNLYDVLNSMKASQSNIIKIAKDMVSDMLPLLDVDGTALEPKLSQQAAMNSILIEKHDDSQIPVRSKEANIQAIKEAIKASSKSLSDIEIERLWKEGVNESIDQCELNHKILLDTLSDVVDILSAYWWNTHTKEAQHSARLLEPILEKLEDIQKSTTNN